MVRGIFRKFGIDMVLRRLRWRLFWKQHLCYNLAPLNPLYAKVSFTCHTLLGRLTSDSILVFFFRRRLFRRRLLRFFRMLHIVVYYSLLDTTYKQQYMPSCRSTWNFSKLHHNITVFQEQDVKTVTSLKWLLNYLFWNYELNSAIFLLLLKWAFRFIILSHLAKTEGIITLLMKV